MEKPPTPHVLLISIDTLRSDHVSCYGYERPTTPELDRLAQDGTRFTHAFGTAVWTPPSHGSMLTGLYPSQHGVVDENRLTSAISTAAEMLAATGYRTLGVVNNSQVGALTGLDRGHQSFHEVWRGIKSKNAVERGLRFAARRWRDFRGQNDHGAARGDLTTQLLISKINMRHCIQPVGAQVVGDRLGMYAVIIGRDLSPGSMYIADKADIRIIRRGQRIEEGGFRDVDSPVLHDIGGGARFAG